MLNTESNICTSLDKFHAFLEIQHFAAVRSPKLCFEFHLSDKWVVIDVAKITCRTLNISGVLEMEYKKVPNSQNYYNLELIADLIIIHGGRFLIGWPDQPNMASRRYLGNLV